MNNTLESYKIFPYIAWAIVIGFSIFTYFLTVRVNNELSNIGDGVARLEQKVDEIDARNTPKVVQ